MSFLQFSNMYLLIRHSPRKQVKEDVKRSMLCYVMLCYVMLYPCPAFPLELACSLLTAMEVG